VDFELTDYQHFAGLVNTNFGREARREIPQQASVSRSLGVGLVAADPSRARPFFCAC
jgi:hypothetical protein